MKKLFEELKIRNTVIRNRLCVPPMVYFNLSDSTGKATEKNAEHYKSLAEGGFGLIIVEANAVEKEGRLSFDQLGLWNDDQIEGHKKIVEQIKKENVAVVVQIHHAGVMGVCKNIVSSSEYTVRERTARALTTDEVKYIENSFVNAAIRAEKAGYDGVELHGAHSYLLTQFLNSRVNKREDEYGEDRTLIVKNMLKKIRENTNDDFIVGIRMGAFEPTIDDGINHAKTFEQIGLDFLNVSYGFSLEADDPTPSDFPFSGAVYGAGEVKKHVNIPVFAVNGITTAKQAKDALEATDVDMICIGKGALVNPNWANDAKNEKEVGKCLNCPNCFFRTGDKDCAGRVLLLKSNK